MRIVGRTRYRVTFALLVLLSASVAYADDPPIPDPQAKIGPPGGAPVQPRVLPRHGAPVQREILIRATDDPSAKIRPPGGVTSPDEQSFRVLLMQWLARVASPLS